MAKVFKIPDPHHVVRHCKNKLLQRHGGTGAIYGVFPELFHLRKATPERPKDEKYLSSQYYEFFHGCADMMKKCLAALQCSLQIKPNDGLVRLNAQKIKEQGVKRSKKLRVTHEPEKIDPGYSTIRGLPLEPDHQLCAWLAQLAVIEIKQVRDI